jgi:mannose-6-phosphate isomerase
MPNSVASIAPFRIAPRFVGRIWGSHDLRPWYDKLADEEPIGEVWLNGDDCLADSGPLAGSRLGDLFQQHSAALLGVEYPGSPLLLKMIFAQDKLSVQVHPDDAMAQKYGDPRGKTECWLALAAEKGARVACGLKPGVTLDTVREGITNGTLEDSLSLLEVHVGEMFFVDAGTVHAIWPGSVLLETQQNCDLTYRMYDYGRPRQLHIEKSLEAIRLRTKSGKIAAQELADRTVLINKDYFRVERLKINGQRSGETLPAPGEPKGLQYLFAATGAAHIVSTTGAFDPVELPERGLVAIPASSPALMVEEQGDVDLIRIAPNWPGKQ